MTVHTIPARTQLTCDGCGAIDPERRQNGILVVHQDALDFSGVAVADGTVKRDLCDECLRRISNAITAEIALIQSGIQK